ncbi:MAG: exodeoxyribonuclease [Myxococcaceae bacterium]|nr:exodeoxyribonuclease [Myxococcaceae bacterium]
MKIATYNINGINGRLSRLLEWLDARAPDVVCLQELKTVDSSFPYAALRKAGYHAVCKGERAYNGVAILSKGSEPLVTRRELPGGPEDKQSRYLEAAVNGVLIASIYAPNGNPQPGPKFDYKLAWLERLRLHARSLRAAGVPAVLAGDFNVVPTDRDIYSAVSSWKDDALLQPESRKALARVLAQGFTDALRELHPRAPLYTFWDYKRNAWTRNAGLRIDQFLLSKQALERLVAGEVDTSFRGLVGASDHAPAWIELC